MEISSLTAKQEVHQIFGLGSAILNPLCDLRLFCGILDELYTLDEYLATIRTTDIYTVLGLRSPIPNNKHLGKSSRKKLPNYLGSLNPNRKVRYDIIGTFGARQFQFQSLNRKVRNYARTDSEVDFSVSIPK